MVHKYKHFNIEQLLSIIISKYIRAWMIIDKLQVPLPTYLLISFLKNNLACKEEDPLQQIYKDLLFIENNYNYSFLNQTLIIKDS